MGLPWYVAATVISIAHIDSLKMETETSAPGEQPKFLGVRYVPMHIKDDFFGGDSYVFVVSWYKTEVSDYASRMTRRLQSWAQWDAC